MYQPRCCVGASRSIDTFEEIYPCFREIIRFRKAVLKYPTTTHTLNKRKEYCRTAKPYPDNTEEPCCPHSIFRQLKKMSQLPN